MLSSHKTASHRSLYSSTTQLVISSTSRTSLRTRGTSTTRRDFSWGSKHKLGSNRAGKVWKGFSTRDAAGKESARKQIYGGTFYNYHYPGTLRRHLQRYPGVQEVRLSSSWGNGSSSPKKGDQVPEANSKPQEKAYGDWYTRWQKREETRYSDLVKRIEEDPFGALFGKKWVNWIDDAVHKDIRGASDSSTLAPKAHGNTLVPEVEKTTWKWASEVPKSSDKVAGSKRTSAPQPTEKVVSVESQTQEYEFDPISMRKVLKRAPFPVSKVETQVQGPPKSFDIPVKRWREHVSSLRATNESASTNSAPTAPSAQVDKSWLAQEGFGSRREQRADPRRAIKTAYVDSLPTITKIQSALDRHLQGKESYQGVSQRPIPQYKPKENTTEDVDLLRSSDVRASAGLRGKAAKESNAEKQARQRILEEQYDLRPLDRENSLSQELASTIQLQEHISRISEQDPSDPGLSAKDQKNQLALDGKPAAWMNEVSDAESGESDSKKAPGISQVGVPTPAATANKSAASADKVGKLRAQIVPLKARLDAMKADYDALRQRWLIERRRQEQAKKMDVMHEEEVKTQKIAMAAIETRGTEQPRKPNMIAVSSVEKEQGAKNLPRQQLRSLLPGEGDLSSNVHEFARSDRWYKRKAPHAMDEMDAKYQQITKDKALIQEIRGIYEESYGTIDTKHRQPTRPEAAPKSDVASQSLPSASSNASRSITSPEPVSTAPTAQYPGTVETSEPLAIIQKLFSELRQAQTLLQEHRARLNSGPVKPSSDVEHLLSTSVQTQQVFQPVVMQIAKQALKLGRMTGLTEEIAAAAATAISRHSVSTRHPSKAASSMLNQAPPFVYRILAYDSATEKVTSAKATSLAPFSKEQQLLPVEALEVLNNPGKFLPLLMTLHNKGYSVVSGTSNILVFKKEATGDELAAARHAEAVRHPNPIDGTVAQTGNFASPTGFVNHDSPIPLDELEARAEEQAAEDQASDSKPVSSGTVRREEDVFSGSHRGNWQEAGARHHRDGSKHGRRQKGMFGRMLLTGTITAACCYTIGLASEMMR